MLSGEIEKMLKFVKIFRDDVMLIEEERSTVLVKQANKHLLDIYKFHLSYKNSFIETEYLLKNLYTSFNYAAVIINEALKKKKLEPEKSVLLEECFETMLTCCDNITVKLTKKSSAKKKK